MNRIEMLRKLREETNSYADSSTILRRRYSDKFVMFCQNKLLKLCLSVVAPNPNLHTRKTVKINKEIACDSYEEMFRHAYQWLNEEHVTNNTVVDGEMAVV